MSQMVIRWDSLSAEALEGIITEFVSREGTEYGQQDVPLPHKIESVRRQLADGSAVIVYDSDLDSCNIVPATEVDL
ncbi:MAG: YheU family protein [Gammaproteobacteria bacterium]|nr:YheU family protein [Gammaproteobacteria bacterium]